MRQNPKKSDYYNKEGLKVSKASFIAGLKLSY